MNKLVSSKLPETKFLSNNICVRIMSKQRILLITRTKKM